MASPRSPVGRAVVAGDEAIWRKLREAGFDEESVRRRDKAALIAYISQLESEVLHSPHPLTLGFGHGGVVFWGFFQGRPFIQRGGKER